MTSHQLAVHYITQSARGKIPPTTDLALSALIARIIELCEPLENE